MGRSTPYNLRSGSKKTLPGGKSARMVRRLSHASPNPLQQLARENDALRSGLLALRAQYDQARAESNNQLMDIELDAKLAELDVEEQTRQTDDLAFRLTENDKQLHDLRKLLCDREEAYRCLKADIDKRINAAEVEASLRTTCAANDLIDAQKTKLLALEQVVQEHKRRWQELQKLMQLSGSRDTQTCSKLCCLLP
ncbi:MAG: hypothetical protein M1816_008243 [Peltula sp. TS41687]|nr:MAG: hypothetical protein M1816_008243 [Peltula sp. TS41687]